MSINKNEHGLIHLTSIRHNPDAPVIRGDHFPMGLVISTTLVQKELGA